MKKYIGIDIGGMSIKGGIIAENGEILQKNTCPTIPDMSYQDMAKAIFDLCITLIENANLSKKDIIAVGIGCPGTIWKEKGIITYANNLGFKNVHLVEEFQKYWEIPTFIENDANAAALGESKFGSGKGYRNCIFITLGTGIGGGIIINGDIFSGERGAGAEVGHTVIKINGEKCTCGRRGCWEAYASATALIRDTKRVLEKNPDTIMHKIVENYGKASGRTCFEAAKLGDEEGKKLVKRYVKYIGCGVCNLVNIFRPEIVMIGGGMSNEGDYFIKMIEKYVQRHNYGGNINPKVKIVRATLLNDAGIMGAASIAM